jgi:hypothetical protein
MFWTVDTKVTSKAIKKDKCIRRTVSTNQQRSTYQLTPVAPTPKSSFVRHLVITNSRKPKKLRAEFEVLTAAVRIWLHLVRCKFTDVSEVLNASVMTAMSEFGVPFERTTLFIRFHRNHPSILKLKHDERQIKNHSLQNANFHVGTRTIYLQ